MLSYINSAIDSIQNAKTQFLSTFVKEKAIQEPMQAFVDAQTAFAKTTAKTANDVVNAISKIDYTQLAKSFK